MAIEYTLDGVLAAGKQIADDALNNNYISSAEYTTLLSQMFMAALDIPVKQNQIAISSVQSEKDLAVKDAQIALINSQKLQYDKYPVVKKGEMLSNVLLGALSGGVATSDSLVTNTLNTINSLNA